MPTKRLDQKLAAIRDGAYSPDKFIIADAKDGDMAFGIATPGPVRDAAGKPTNRFRPLADYRDDIERVTQSDLVDIMLMSLSTAEAMAHKGLFESSAITPAVRLNDTTDIWQSRHGVYKTKPALPFRTARIEHAQKVANLGLYAITFYNDLAQDHATLEAYAKFRAEAEGRIRHFLEIFNPQFPIGLPDAEFAAYNDDMITCCLAGQSRQERPVFLKAAYNGPRATEEIASYDPGNIIFGVLGGGAGTTRDCLELIIQAERYGARVALFGRKIYYAEDSVLMVAAMRRVLESGMDSDEGTRAYHGDLMSKGIHPFRTLEDDLAVTEPLLKANM